MLYPKTKSLDITNMTELRMLKMEEQRLANISLLSNLSKYANIQAELSILEKKIGEEIFSLYTVDSTYSDLLHKLSKAMTFKADMVKKNTLLMQDCVEKSKKLETFYDSLKPLFKNYFTSLQVQQHYEKKVPKVISKTEERKRNGIQLTSKETEKLVRNKRKLENSRTDMKVIHECIIAETNLINLDRFDILNPLVKQFITFQMSNIYIMNEKWAGIKTFEQVLEKKESDTFNDKYFLDIEKKMRSRMMKDNLDIMARSAEAKLQPMMNQNVQNNYYYINQNPTQKMISQFDPDEDFNMPNNFANHAVKSIKENIMDKVKMEIEQAEDDSMRSVERDSDERLLLPILNR